MPASSTSSSGDRVFRVDVSWLRVTVQLPPEAGGSAVGRIVVAIAMSRRDVVASF